MTPRTTRSAAVPDEQPKASDATAGGAAETHADAQGQGDGQALPAEIAELSYEAARDQLVDVVRRLESGQGGLEESIGLWERGEMLATRCQQWLDGARERLDEAVSARGRGGENPSA